MAATNGLGVGNAAAYNAANNGPSFFPGSFTDMQFVLEHMEKLTQTLESNREDWRQVQAGLSKVERMQVCIPHSFRFD